MTSSCVYTLPVAPTFGVAFSIIDKASLYILKMLLVQKKKASFALSWMSRNPTGSYVLCRLRIIKQTAAHKTVTRPSDYLVSKVVKKYNLWDLSSRMRTMLQQCLITVPHAEKPPSTCVRTLKRLSAIVHCQQRCLSVLSNPLGAH